MGGRYVNWFFVDKLVFLELLSNGLVVLFCGKEQKTAVVRRRIPGYHLRTDISVKIVLQNKMMCGVHLLVQNFGQDFIIKLMLVFLDYLIHELSWKSVVKNETVDSRTQRLDFFC